MCFIFIFPDRDDEEDIRAPRSQKKEKESYMTYAGGKTIFKNFEGSNQSSRTSSIFALVQLKDLLVQQTLGMMVLPADDFPPWIFDPVKDKKRVYISDKPGYIPLVALAYLDVGAKGCDCPGH